MTRLLSRYTFLVVGVGITMAALLLAACGDDDDDDGDDGGDDGGAAAIVDVILSEWVVEPDPDSASAGEVTFSANNNGAEVHELVVVKTDLGSGDLPTGDDGSVDEEGGDMEVVDEIEDIASGDTIDLTVDLEAGNYVLLCNIVEEEESGELESHYQQGMHASFSVE